jgi:hypothetical protein
MLVVVVARSVIGFDVRNALVGCVLDGVFAGLLRREHRLLLHRRRIESIHFLGHRFPGVLDDVSDIRLDRLRLLCDRFRRRPRLDRLILRRYGWISSSCPTAR